jgi:hypothetical protein
VHEVAAASFLASSVSKSSVFAPLFRSNFLQKFQRMGAIADSSFELFRFDCLEDLFEAWAGAEAEGD